MYRPQYYRWIYDEQGDVSLSHNKEGHPASIPTLNEMAKGGTVANKGYAYRIHGGWRITDFEHKPVNDPHILRTVTEAIAKVEHTT